ncbi:MAG: hypothetical protein P8175_16920 [Deltaproteobacteria bacterium]|jgi:hypothetical protein
MVMPKDSFHETIQQEAMGSWRALIDSMERSLDMLERGIEEAEVMTEICTPEWCVATENVMDELNNRIFSISEPRWSSEEDSTRLRHLRKRLHDCYERYKAVSGSTT